MVANKDKCIIKNKMPSIFQLIVGFKQKHQSKIQDLVNTWLMHAFPIAKLGTTTDFQRTEMSYSNNDFQLVVDSKLILNCEGACTFPDGSSKFIVASHLEGKNKAESDTHGGQQQFPIFNISPLQMLTFEGAQAAPNHSHQLIVIITLRASQTIYNDSKIFLHFFLDYKLFCEGE
jgi:hypothetical protein